MPLNINPPLINSANPWATTIDDLRALYNCPHTGAVTTRTCLLGTWPSQNVDGSATHGGFPHDPKIHQYTFFTPSLSPDSKMATVDSNGQSEVLPGQDCSLNTLGYSPISLFGYIKELTVASMEDFGQNKDFVPTPSKPFIVSVTGSAEDISHCYKVLNAVNFDENVPSSKMRFMMEINLSCPNIPDKPPPAYSSSALDEYLISLANERSKTANPIQVGIKTPPYTYQDQFTSLITSLKKSAAYPGGCPISFITSTNTLGSCLVLSPTTNKPALSSANGTGIGGLAGAALHPLALGNVATIRRMLDECEEEGIRGIEIIGIGGVSDRAGFERMRSVGASVVGVGTALGREGVSIFEKILNGVKDEKSVIVE